MKRALREFVVQWDDTSMHVLLNGNVTPLLTYDFETPSLQYLKQFLP